MENPLWIQEMINKGMLINKHKFSKFLSGVSIFHEQKVLDIKNEYECKLPYWFQDKQFIAYKKNNIIQYNQNIDQRLNQMNEEEI